MRHEQADDHLELASSLGELRLAMDACDDRDPYVYLASPYTSYPLGYEAAHDVACDAAAWLIEHRVPVFCPIAHSHPISTRSPALADADHDTWLAEDRPFVLNAAALVVLWTGGVEESHGIGVELSWARELGLPVFRLHRRGHRNPALRYTLERVE